MLIIFIIVIGYHLNVYIIFNINYLFDLLHVLYDIVYFKNIYIYTVCEEILILNFNVFILRTSSLIIFYLNVLTVVITFRGSKYFNISSQSEICDI